MSFIDINDHKIKLLKNISFIVEWKIKLMFSVIVFRIEFLFCQQCLIFREEKGKKNHWFFSQSVHVLNVFKNMMPFILCKIS